MMPASGTRIDTNGTLNLAGTVVVDKTKRQTSAHSRTTKTNGRQKKNYKDAIYRYQDWFVGLLHET